MRLSRARLHQRQSKAPYLNHRSPPWLTEDATRHRSNRLLFAAGMNRCIVLYDWKRVVEAVQKIPPILIRQGFAEANRVVLKSAPTDDKNISVLNFKATTKLMRNIPRGRRDNSRGDFKRGFKLCAMARQDRQNRYL